ncbi:MAG: hypothetical protein U9Q72_02355 [Patescibacteria group bacterium]|nr:hypothetical protein [Patescibacteria group bacterium]
MDNMKENNMEKRDFAFLAHRVESWNRLLDFRIFKHLHKNSKLHWFYVWLAPFYWSSSFISLFAKKGYGTVDDFKFAGMNGQTILLKNYGWHFLSSRLKEKMKGRILEAVLCAQEKGSGVIGLGALVKNEELTQGGQWIVDQLGDKLKTPLVHGDTLTAVTVLKQIDAVRTRESINPLIFITGATSKIGRAVVLTLAKNKIFVKMFTRDKERFMSIRDEAGRFGKYLSRASSLQDGQDCQLWLTGKSEPSGKKLLQTIPNGVVVINFSVPNPLGENKLHPRKDLVVVEGGLLEYDPSKTDLFFTMRLRPGLTYACHAGTAVHAYQGWTQHEVGPVEVSMLSEVWRIAQEIGFFLPALPARQTKWAKEAKPFWGKLANMPASIVF